jgi:hypothetical protein
MLSVPRPQRQGVLGRTLCAYSQAASSCTRSCTVRSPRRLYAGSDRRQRRSMGSYPSQVARRVRRMSQLLDSSLPPYATPFHGLVGPSRGPGSPRNNGAFAVGATVAAVGVHESTLDLGCVLIERLILRPRPCGQHPLMPTPGTAHLYHPVSPRAWARASPLCGHPRASQTTLRASCREVEHRRVWRAGGLSSHRA